MTRRHQHRVVHVSAALPFDGSVSRRENRVAHGNCSYLESCRCGANRRVNANAGQREVGPWYMPTEKEVAR